MLKVVDGILGDSFPAGEVASIAASRYFKFLEGFQDVFFFFVFFNSK